MSGESEEEYEQAIEQVLEGQIEFAWRRELDTRRVSMGRDCGALLPTQRRVGGDDA